LAGAYQVAHLVEPVPIVLDLSNKGLAGLSMPSMPPLPTILLYPRYRVIPQFSVVVVIVESFVVDRLDDFIPRGFVVEMDMNNLFIFQFPRKLDAV
jgi:hypothetical protein